MKKISAAMTTEKSMAVEKSRANYVLSALEEDILTLLSVSPAYGLGISKAIEKASNGNRVINVGSLYPSLRRLEEKNFATSYWESDDENSAERTGARRRYYQISPKGLEILAENQSVRENLLQWQPA
jgi:PadR family transcriptional regulator, regulatory protein PadR